MLHAVGVRRGSLPYLERGFEFAAHLPPAARPDRSAPVRGLSGLLLEHHLAPATQGIGGRSDAAGGLRETGGPATTGRAGADDRWAGTVAGTAHGTRPRCGVAAGAAQPDAATTTASTDPPLRCERRIQAYVVATFGFGPLRTLANPTDSIPCQDPVAEVGLVYSRNKVGNWRAVLLKILYSLNGRGLWKLDRRRFRGHSER